MNPHPYLNFFVLCALSDCALACSIAASLGTRPDKDGDGPLLVPLRHGLKKKKEKKPELKMDV